MSIMKPAAVLAALTLATLAGCSAGHVTTAAHAVQLTTAQRNARAVAADCAAYRAFSAKRDGTAAPERTEGSDARVMLAAVSRSGARWHIQPDSGPASAMSSRLALIAAVASDVQLDAALGRSQAMTLASLKLATMMVKADGACGG